MQINELRIPDSFSPNGDGVNDTWEIVGIDKFPENQVRIINRWGETVFETTDYQNNWKGTSTDTSLSADGKVPNGTYFYIFQLTTDLEPLTGHLVIRK